MKKALFFICCCVGMQAAVAQNDLFKTFADSTTLNRAGDRLIADFVNEVNTIDTTIHLKKPKTAYNVMGPYFMFDNYTVNLPVWRISPKWYKDFCIEMAGGEKQGEEMFGLFFNGFYVPHELGHAIQSSLHKSTNDDVNNAYVAEYNANIIGMLYWKKKGKDAELKRCFDYATQALSKLKNPVPDGVDPKQFFADHYFEFSTDPYKYGFFQWTQYVEVYKARNTLPDFDTFVKNYIRDKSK